MASWLGSILAIFLVDLVLSGDNAIVIGAAASGLPRDQRMLAILVGGGSAVVLRILFSLAATILLQLRFLGIIGSSILLFIALRLLIERSHEQGPIAEEGENTKTRRPFWQRYRLKKNLTISILTILLADVMMSLDNVLAVGGLANGDIFPLIIGLILSIIFLMLGSALVTIFISRLPWLLDIACLIIAWTAAQIFLGDDSLNNIFAQYPWLSVGIPILTVLIVLLTDIYLQIRIKRG